MVSGGAGSRSDRTLLCGRRFCPDAPGHRRSCSASVVSAEGAGGGGSEVGDGVGGGGLAFRSDVALWASLLPGRARPPAFMLGERSQCGGRGRRWFRGG